MTINDLELFLVERQSDTTDPSIRSLLIRLVTETGLVGWGEAVVPWRSSELHGRRNMLLPILTGRSVFDIEELVNQESLRPRPLQAAVEMACWDLVGRIAGLPLCCLFGGQYRGRIPLGVRLHGNTIEQVLQLSREMADQGFYWQTLSATGRMSNDESMVTALLDAVGDRVELRLDGRQSYNMEQAQELCHRLEDRSLVFFLDPISGGRMEEVAALRRQTNVTMAVARLVETPADMMAFIRGGVASSTIIDIQRVGGLVFARKCGTIAEAGGIGAALCAGHSLGIATAATLQLAAATPAYSGCLECTRHQPADELLVEPFSYVDGMICVPQGPGIGVKINRAAIERYQVS
ncbi:MAG: mandelate racemase/muconate lactonizing enzyme family protein [Thermoguttaceae bacterium]